MKSISIIALAASILALFFAVQSKQRLAGDIKVEVQRQLDEREAELVERYRPMINRMLADVGKERIEIKTLEEALDAMTSIFDITGALLSSTNTPAEK